MSQRFHNKLHNKNHHTNVTAGYPDSAVDPIASPSNPFQGDFYLNGSLSAKTIIAQTSFINVLSSGGVSTTIISVTGNYQVQPTDYTVFADGGVSNSTLTLPAASAVPNQLYIFKRTSSTSTVTLSVQNHATLIEQQYDSILLNVQYATIVLLSYQSNWWIEYNSF